MSVTRRTLQLSLATLWMLDGALQCQPFMFTRGFAQNVLAPSSSGQPSPIAVLVHATSVMVAAQPALANAGFAAIQLALGVALVSRRFAHVALASSAVWAVSVWIVGEGLGGVTSGGTILMGAPGAALLYAVLAGLAWPTRDPRDDQRPPWFAIPAWSALWIGAAILQFVSGNSSGVSLSMMFSQASTTVPTWLGGVDRWLGHQQIPAWSTGVLIALSVVAATWIAIPGRCRQLSVGIGVVIALVGWFLVQGLGDFSSGQATDPNCGPLVVLLAVGVLSAVPPHSDALGQAWTHGRRTRDVVGVAS